MRGTPRSLFLRTLQERGFIHQASDWDALDARLSETVVPAYIGFDATADSLHVGSLVPIMMLRWLQQCGHKPIVLMGGGTTKVGDPSGKDSQRQLLDDAQIARNIAGIRRVFEKFLTFGDGPTDAVMVDNANWLDGLAYIPFLRDIGRHFSINRMLSFESVRLRLERDQPLSFLEFNYMILQAYDYLELYRRHGCCLQMGGSDQWGNIVNGFELIRRVEGGEAFALTAPLITTASGAKMGKTADGAIWLNEDKCGAYDYWQYFRNTLDSDVGRFLRLYTELPLAEIARLEALEGAGLNEAKKILATEATAMVHGRAKAEEAAETARRTFEDGAAGEDLPRVAYDRAALEAGVELPSALVALGLCASKGEARRLIRQGGAKVNNAKATDEHRLLTLADQDGGGSIKLSAGKKKHGLLTLGEAS